MFETEVFREQMYCIEESICDIVGTFSAPPAVIRRPGNCATPRYDPVLTFFITKSSRNSLKFVYLSLSLLMHRMFSVENFSWNIAAL